MKRQLIVLAIAAVFLAPAVFACSSQGPQDPVTGLITYPGNYTGAPEDAKTEVPPDLIGTPFEGGKFIKAWSGNDMKVIIVPVGTTLGFEGVIQSTDPNVGRPSAWEEGQKANLYGTTVDQAPKPAWTISGNGRGDYRDGSAPPVPGALAYREFENPAKCIIVDDTPAVKALWKLSYDPETAKKMIYFAAQDPLKRALLEEKLSGTGLTLDTILNSTGLPKNDFGVKDWDVEKVIEPNVDANVVRGEFDTYLPHGSGDSEPLPAQIARTYLIPGGGTATHTVMVYPRVRKTIKAGYIAMQEWYPSGNYNTKYLITPPSGTVTEKMQSRLEFSFKTPTSPDYWTVDLNSGLESTKDCVWCWIEGDQIPKPENAPVANESDAYTIDTNPSTMAVGGVFVRGYYSSGASSVGRNTVVRVVVVDTKPPATFEWLNYSDGLKAVAGKALKDTVADGSDPSIKFKVYDNNPVIGASTYNSILTLFPEMDQMAFYEGGKAGNDVGMTSDDPKHPFQAFKRFIEPVKDGFTAAALNPQLVYNVNVPAYIGLKVTDDRFPSNNGKFALPTQKFQWKSTGFDPTLQITNRKIYDENGNAVADLDALGEEFLGFSSFDVEVPLEKLKEPMGFNFAENSKAYSLSLGKELSDDIQIPPGIPVFNKILQNYKWSTKALKVFPVCSDGIGNQSPSVADLTDIVSKKFSGVEVTSDKNAVCKWTDPNSIILDDPVPGTPIPAGSFGGCTKAGGNPTAWGPFLNVTQLKDETKPYIALEILNAKNNQRVMYGNLAALARSPEYWSAFKSAGAKDAIRVVETNASEAEYIEPAEKQVEAEEWVFDGEKDVSSLIDFQTNLETFRPWFYAVDKTIEVEPDFWKNHWTNAGADAPRYKLAYQHDTRERLVFRYWAWDNINGFNHDEGNSGLNIMGTSEKFNVAGGKKVLAKCEMLDKPACPNTGGVVPEAQFWPDYIFHNPSLSGATGGNYEECSLSLSVKDESGNARQLKVYFNIAVPGTEIIRTLEDKRERK